MKLPKWLSRRKPNFKHLEGIAYWVKNQQGFNQALYHCVGCIENNDGDMTKKEIRDAVKQWPLSYPCEIQIQDLTFSSNRIFLYHCSVPTGRKG